MRSMHILLDEAEPKWRKEVSQSNPLWARTEVVKDRKASLGRDWEFSTDHEKIYANISNDKSLQKKFEDIVTKFWNGNPEELAEDVLHYLLFHEIYHPWEAPFSKEDNKKIYQAIRRGLLKAEPKLSPLEQIVRVQASQNSVKDFILDNRFALDNKEQEYIRDDVIPIWDLLELQDAKSTDNFYTITRYMYGLLYAPESTHEFFSSKLGEKGREIAGKALSKLLEKKVMLPDLEKKSLAGKAKDLFVKGEKSKQGVYGPTQEYVRDIRKVFSSDDRYKGIERFMSVLGPYIQKNMPQVRPDQCGEGTGTSGQSILQDLLDDMTEEEQSSFLSQLASTSEGKRRDVFGFAPGTEDSTDGTSKNTEELSNLDVLAMHEFYKRNHPEVRITGGNKIGESVVVGKRQYWQLTRSNVLTQDQLRKVNLEHVAKFQRKTRLPMLIPLENGMFRFNEYTLKEKEVKDIAFVEENMNVPDVLDIYVDSSGSMYQNTSNHGFNDGSRWDMLSHALYGYVDGIRQAEGYVGRHCMMQIHNVADSQVNSPIISVEEFWQGHPETLRVLFKPENGYNEEDLNIKAVKDNKKRTYFVATDGELVIHERTARESRKMKDLGAYHNNEVMLCEIGGTYGLGKAVRKDPNIHYFQAHDKEEMLQNGLEVLLSK